MPPYHDDNTAQNRSHYAPLAENLVKKSLFSLNLIEKRKFKQAPYQIVKGLLPNLATG